MVQPSATTAHGDSYDIIVTERSGRFYLRISELNLIVDGSDVASAHAALAVARHAQVDRHAALGLPLPLPRDAQVRRELFDRVVPFMLKTAAVAIAGGVLFVCAVVSINYVLREPLRHGAQKVAHAAVEQITAGLEDFARQGLTPEREERLRQALRGAVPLIRPLIEEAAPLFPDGPKQPPR
jgi:hypothetical protein